MILRGMFGAGADPDAVIRRAFAAGEDGIWVAPRLGGMFQDAALATPWTADGQAVGGYVDRSPNGYVLTQATATARPAGYSTLLRGDGVDDTIICGPGLDLDRTMFAVAVYRASAADNEGLLFGKNTGSFGTTSYRVRRNNGRTRLELFNATTQILDLFAGVDTNYDVRVESFLIDRDAGTASIRRNGVTIATTSFTTGGGSVAVAPGWRMFAPGFLAVDEHEIVQVMRMPAAGELEAIEQRLIVAHNVETGGGGKWFWRRCQRLLPRARRRHRRVRRGGASRSASRWAS